MFFNCKGSAHALVCVLVILVGFGVALGLPQYNKQQTLKRAEKALALGKALAFAEANYKQAFGKYTEDFTKLRTELPCPFEEGELRCPYYTFRLENENEIRIQHADYPKWFTVKLDEGSIDCSHEEDSIVGQHICGRVETKKIN